MELQKLISDNPLNDFMNHENLIIQLNSEFNSDEQKQFVMHFYLYQKYDKTTDFIIDLDKIWEWLDFAKKCNAKTLLQKNFIQDVHYKILTPQQQEQKTNEDNRGGHNKEIIMMTINTFKSFCLKARTTKAAEIHEYYIKLEDIIMSSLMKGITSQTQIFKGEKEELIKQLEIANQKNKHTKETCGILYIAGNLKESKRDIYKVGFAIDENREFSMNTCESDGCFKILRKFKTSHRILLEKFVHAYLDVHKFKYNKEFYNIELDILINICELFTTFVNHMDSMTIEELNTKLKMINNVHQSIKFDSGSNITNNDNSTTINIQVPQDQMENFKYFSMDTYKQFIEENIIPQIDSHVLSEQLRNAFSKWISTKNIKPKKYNVRQLYMTKQGFHNEFKDAFENVLEIPQTRIYNSGKIRGFDHIKLKDECLI
jgi:hypothetical protein